MIGLRRKRCGHEHVRCVHDVDGAVCLDCGRSIPHPPIICTETHEPHAAPRPHEQQAQERRE